MTGSHPTFAWLGFDAGEAEIRNRCLDRTFGRPEYSPFGADTRGCMSARIAHGLGRILVEELCIGYTWRLTRTGPPERGSRERDHGRPSQRSLAVLRPI